MDYLYVLVCNGAEWEDTIIILDKEEAIQASIKFYKCRVEIFKKGSVGYVPTYNYYAVGEYYGTP